MRKILSLLLATICAVSLVACAKEDIVPTVPIPSENPVATTPIETDPVETEAVVETEPTETTPTENITVEEFVLNPVTELERVDAQSVLRAAYINTLNMPIMHMEAKRVWSDIPPSPSGGEGMEMAEIAQQFDGTRVQDLWMYNLTGEYIEKTSTRPRDGNVVTGGSTYFVKNGCVYEGEQYPYMSYSYSWKMIEGQEEITSEGSRAGTWGIWERNWGYLPMFADTFALEMSEDGAQYILTSCDIVDKSISYSTEPIKFRILVNVDTLTFLSIEVTTEYFTDTAVFNFYDGQDLNVFFGQIPDKVYDQTPELSGYYKSPADFSEEEPFFMLDYDYVIAMIQQNTLS